MNNVSVLGRGCEIHSVLLHQNKILTFAGMLKVIAIIRRMKVIITTIKLIICSINVNYQNKS